MIVWLGNSGDKRAIEPLRIVLRENSTKEELFNGIYPYTADFPLAREALKKLGASFWEQRTDSQRKEIEIGSGIGGVTTLVSILWSLRLIIKSKAYTQMRLEKILRSNSGERLTERLLEFFSGIKDLYLLVEMIESVEQTRQQVKEYKSGKGDFINKAVVRVLEILEQRQEFYFYNRISEYLHKEGNPAGDLFYERSGPIVNPGAGHWENQSYYNGSVSAMGDSWEWISEEEHAWEKKPRPDAAMLEKNHEILQAKISSVKYGGIDLNHISIQRTGHVIKMQFDPAQIQELEKDGFEGFTPVIEGMVPILSPLPLLGIAPRRENEIVAQVN